MVNFDGNKSGDGEMAATKHHNLHLKKDIAVPKVNGGCVPQPAAGQKVNHPLAMDQSRAPTVGDWLKHHELLGGNAHTEQELHTASQINRGPPGTYSGSNLHFQMLTGQDERIGFHFGDVN